MKDCIFCKIVNKELPSNIIYEDDICIAILDITQVTRGHTLVLPKIHNSNVFDASSEVLQHIMLVIKLIVDKMHSNLDINNINILNNSGTIAGQTVDHLHFHIIPRYNTQDSISIKFNTNKESICKEILCELLYCDSLHNN